MQSELRWRLIIILIVTVLCLILIYPTARYFAFIALNQRPADEKQAQEWDKKAEELRRKSLRLGLDLQGGVDVLLEVDVKKTVADQLRDLALGLRTRFLRNDVEASLEILQDENALLLSITEKKNYRIVENILNDYKETFEPPDIEELRSTGKLVLKLRPQMIDRYVRDAIEGALMVVRRRVDELGLTQPSVAPQGETRIRIQLPGEKDPERVFKNILKAAQLEFRLLHDENDKLVAELFDENGNLKPGKSLPPGYVLRYGVVVRYDEKTRRKVKKEHVPFIVKNNVEITGKYLRNAWVQFNQASLVNPINIALLFDSVGAKRFREITAQNVGKRLAIILDDYVYSAPVIKTEIPNGSAVIEGDFTQQEATDLALVLKAGALPAPLRPIEKRAVGATLGTESIRDSVRALFFGGLAVLIFMIVYYGTAGIIADFAVLLNILLILAVLSLARATLTLSGIGGILLTIGMAVDGNILIYERIREELSSGRPLKFAITQGFRRAFSVIFDSNLTTLVTALVLLQFAEGSVKGFALTMSIGLIANLYTSLTVTKTFTEFWVHLRNKINVGSLKLFKSPRINFLSLRKGAYVLSLSLIALCIFGFIKEGGPVFDVDFQGGVLSDVAFNKQVTELDIRKAIEEAGLTGRVQHVLGKNEYLIRVKNVENSVEKTQAMIEQALTDHFGKESFTVLSTQSVGNEIGQEFIRIALTAVIIASGCILLYVGLRFQFTFGSAAILALLHDLIITLGIITLLKVNISLDVVSALLIVLGYSVNDTIVIFDRIRENLRTVYGKKFEEIANMSINQSLNRTILTAMTSLFTVTAMYLFGGKGLQPFALTLIIGIAIGTYSSSFVATPFVYEWFRYKGIKVEKEKAKVATTAQNYRNVKPLKVK